MRRFPIARTPRLFRGVLFAMVCGAGMALPPPATLAAQEPALAGTVGPVPRIEYNRNESGGRISLVSPSSDSASIESVRVVLLESAAAFRRGDFSGFRLANQQPTVMQLLADQRGAIRCTVRLTARGGDLVLLSNDDRVIAAIHQLLAGPPAIVRL